ncbi:GNAT family N-acetyltransferase [Octadecabacter sp. G9-8]|uniref:Acyl-homoserine-lactone synthase n=1 Tax=Octadecabacter dasysiphoniae TaxID=2909341 RepID=A0ABS9CQU7_9RHOB|nr:acyl-homoserine-lactone synthase [Octadecabacter dasysiphoniae]MCF2869447.1 GNAT family N-acetyltransferase [Octadecabacter dasysiphoniae]
MIRYISGTDLWLFPDLAHSMFRDRARQFFERPNWEIDVDRGGCERDQYDLLNPIYVVVDDDAGHHVGSMRLLPTTGSTAINDYFSRTLECGPIHDPMTWECTRFCLSPSAELQTVGKVFASAGRLMQEFNITSLIAIFDQLMLRRYRLSGVAPELLGDGDFSGGRVLSGRWQFNKMKLDVLMRHAGLDFLECELALANSPFYLENRLFSEYP